MTPLRTTFLSPGRAANLAAVRIATGAFAVAYLVLRLPHLWSLSDLPDSRFEPVGVTHVLDTPLPGGPWALVLAATIGLGLMFALGVRFAVSAPVFALLLLWVTTYRNSWGVVLHTENLLVLHVGVLSLTRAADVWSLDSRNRPPPEPSSAYRWPLAAVTVVTVCTYVVAAWAKAKNGGVDWLTGDLLRNHVAHDNLRKHLLGDPSSPLAPHLLGSAWFWTIASWATIFLEWCAPLALLGRRLSRAFVVAAFGFHWAILAVMAIAFPYQLTGAAFVATWLLHDPARFGRRRDSSVNELSITS